MISTNRNVYKGKEPAGPGKLLFLSTPLWLREFGSTCRKEGKKFPVVIQAQEQVTCKDCGITVFGDFQNSSSKSLSNLTSEVDLPCVGGWPAQAHRSQPVSYNFKDQLFLEQTLWEDTLLIAEKWKYRVLKWRKNTSFFYKVFSALLCSVSG